MTGLERVLATCEGKEPDRVPLCPMICSAARRVYGVSLYEFSTDGEIAGKSVVATVQLFGYDAVLWMYNQNIVGHDFGQDIEVLLHGEPRPKWGKPLLPNANSYNDVKPIQDASITRPAGFSPMKEYIKSMDVIMNEIGDKVAVVACSLGTLILLGTLRGAEHLFFDCVKYPEAIMAAQVVLQEGLGEYIDNICKQTKPFGFCLETSFASGGIMSKKLWKKSELSTSRVLSDKIRENDTTVWVHNCGNAVYFDVQIEAMDPLVISYAYVPDDCSDFSEMKRKYGNKIVLHGHISPNERLFLGTREELLEEGKTECDTLKLGGRYILAPGCEFPSDGNLNRVTDMMEAAELYGKY